MDHKQKLMATPSCQGQDVHAETMVDRISNLPDEVAHHILSFLTITDVARFGCVSKRCGQLHLSTPSLKNIHLVEDGFFRWVSSSCKCIKELLLERIDGAYHLSIESSSLESFSYVHPFRSQSLNLSISAEKLVDLVIDWGFQDCKKVLNITAPKVKYLKLSGNSLIHQNLGELMRLGGNDINILSEFLLSIRRVKALIIAEETLKAFFKKGSGPLPLDNVHHLCMHVGYFLDDVVPSMVSLLKGIPNLSTLYIKSFPIFIYLGSKSSGYNVAYWKLLNLAFVDQLEEVTIELPNGSNGIELASYMLKHAKSLKKMVIVHSPEQSSVARKLLKTYRFVSEDPHDES